MTISTILLIAVAAALVFIMIRVGRGTREAAHPHAAVSPPNPDEQGQAEPQGHVGHGQDGEGGNRKGHGCC
jgi:hypothetical protein